MTNTFLYIYWALLYGICAALGFIRLPGWVGVAACLLFFLPPAVLLYRAVKNEDRQSLRRIRNICLIALGVAVLMIILNIASVGMSAQAGDILYGMMILLTGPMVCGQSWLLGLFGWACLLMASLQQLKKQK